MKTRPAFIVPPFIRKPLVRPPLIRTPFVMMVLLLLVGCAGGGGWSTDPAPLRLSTVASEGDATRRASLRMVIEGLEAEMAGSSRRAIGQYERAIQVDASNPYPYLAMARHYIYAGDPRRGLENLDQAEVLLDSQGERTRGVEADLAGLRAAGLEALGRSAEAAPLWARAQDLEPSVWNDRRLDPGELR